MEFTNGQLARIDEIDNAAFEFCKVLTEKEDLEWNMEFIGEIAEMACDILVKKGFKIRFPAHVESRFDGMEYITDWHEAN